MTEAQLQKREAELAAEVMQMSVGKLLLRRHYFSSALGRLSFQQLGGSFLTDGRRVCYDPALLLSRYESSDLLPVHDLLHALLHNVFRHWSVGRVRAKLWDAACDIAAEALIADIDAELVPIENAQRREQVLRRFASEVKPLTAEKLYNYMDRSGMSDEQAEELCELFAVDDHRTWHKADEQQKPKDEEYLPDICPISDGDENAENNDGNQQTDDDAKGESGSQDKQENQQGKSSQGGEQSSSSDLDRWNDAQQSAQQGELDEQWEQIAKQIQSEIENFGRNESSLQLIDVLEHVTREKTDYRAFLRRFAVMGEVMKSDLDAFDVNFYCYGMDMYGDVAFIEPPEYKEVRRVRDFVIAIDTSGSVSRRTVHDFVQKTYTILKSEESFFSRVDIHILQCDVQVRDAALINCEQELESYIDGLELKGFGGTDFRPVFEYVDSVRAEGGLRELKGLIYFTDGLGTFPEKAPDYEAAFVFLQGDYEKNANPEIPSWATKIVLQEGDVSDV